jgi:RNA polymerase sigma-54 factor
MLELPTLEFEERIHQELEENPVLEEGSSKDEFQNEEDEYIESEGRNELENEDFNLDEYISDDGIHPSPAGYSALAKKVAEEIRQALG